MMLRKTWVLDAELIIILILLLNILDPEVNNWAQKRWVRRMLQNVEIHSSFHLAKV